MKKVYGNPIFGIAGLAVFLFGGWQFARLAILPRLPGGK